MLSPIGHYSRLTSCVPSAQDSSRLKSFAKSCCTRSVPNEKIEEFEAIVVISNIRMIKNY